MVFPAKFVQINVFYCYKLVFPLSLGIVTFQNIFIANCKRYIYFLTVIYFTFLNIFDFFDCPKFKNIRCIIIIVYLSVKFVLLLFLCVSQNLQTYNKNMFIFVYLFEKNRAIYYRCSCRVLLAVIRLYLLFIKWKYRQLLHLPVF